MRRAWARALLEARVEVLTAEGVSAARALLSTGPAVLVGAPADVEELLEELDPPPPFVAMLEGDASVERDRSTLERAVALVERREQPPLGLAIVVTNALRGRSSPVAASAAPSELEFATVTRAGRTALAAALAAATSPAPLLLVGEDGTGKRTLARSVHSRSRRSGDAFEVDLHAGTSGEELVAALDAAHRDGTVILVGIDRLHAEAQAALGERLTSGAPVARVISTAKSTLRERVQDGSFSRDLFFRLSPIVVDLPPLRVRKDDVTLLAHLFARRGAERFGLSPKRFSREALSALRAWSFPDNAAELDAVVVRALTSSSDDTMRPGDLGLPLPAAKPGGAEPLAYTVEREHALRAFERGYVERVIAHAGGNVAQAARIAAMDPANLRRLVRRVKGSKDG